MYVKCIREQRHIPRGGVSAAPERRRMALWHLSHTFRNSESGTLTTVDFQISWIDNSQRVIWYYTPSS